MAIYDNLPVFKASYDLLLEVFQSCQKLQRDYKFTLGEKLKTEITEMMICIYRANSTPDKGEMLTKAREYVVTIKLYIRLLHDLKQLPIKRYAQLADMTESVSKQLAAWHKSTEKKGVATNVE